MISIIVAVGKNREIGKKNQLLFDIPEDMQRFIDVTKGRTVVMGDKTFQSIGKPLPGRKNIVVNMNITKSMNKFSWFQITNLSHHHGQ